MSEVNAIFDQFMKFSDRLHRADAARKHLDEMRCRATPVCGSCFFWMKSRDCPREHNVNGYNRGPSMSASPCSKFKGTDSFEKNVAAYLALRHPQGESKSKVHHFRCTQAYCKCAVARQDRFECEHFKECPQGEKS